MHKQVSHHPQYPDIQRRPVRRRLALRRPAWLTPRVARVLLVVVLLALLGAAVVATGRALQRAAEGRIAPRISVHGFDLSYHTIQSGQAALNDHYASFLEQPVELAYNGRTWHPSAAELGVRLETPRALKQAVLLNRADTNTDTARTTAALWQQGADLPLTVTIDQQQMQRYLLDVAADVNTPARNANVRLENGEVLITYQQAGVQVLVDETMQQLTAALQRLEPQQMYLRTRSIAPEIYNEDIADLVERLDVILDGPIVATSQTSLCRGACRWEWTPAEIATWVRLDYPVSPDDRVDIALRIDQEALRKALRAVNDEMRIDGALPRVDWNGGNLAISQPGTPGVGLDMPLALAYLNTALQGGPRTIDLPLAEIPPPVIDASLASLNITEPVGVGVSSFRASAPYRITNIQAGARQMDGILIPPGGSFSFNHMLGPVDGLHGFVQGYAIVGNRTQLEWGGGLCQVSTTMYRAAFWAGLPITERHEHTFRIPWYEELGEPPGMDATIFTGVSDLQFVNDTDGWLLTHATVDLQNQQLILTIYGQPSNREVTMSHSVLSRTPPPASPLYIDTPTLPRGTVQQTDWAQGGMHVQVYRTVTENGQVLHQDTFNTIFEPWPNVYLRGTGR
jgi:vancomycin resistance protein YoaR